MTATALMTGWNPMARYTPPRSVINHPAVESCTSGEDEGAEQRHYVILKPGYWFGPQEQTSSLFFDHVTRPKRLTGRVWAQYVGLIERKPD